MAFPPFLEKLDPNIYQSKNYLVLDLEVDTSHGDFGRPLFSDNSLLLACWEMADGRKRSAWGNEIQQRDLFQDLEGVDFIVAHNSIYELGWLRRGGYPIDRLLTFDTQIGEYVLLGNLVSGHSDTGVPPTSISLDSCAYRRGWSRKDPVVDTLMGNGINPVRMPRRWLEDRCSQDVRTTHELFLAQRDKLAASNRLPVLFTRCLLTPVLADIQPEGMQLDPERVTQEDEIHRLRLAELDEQLRGITGGINARSPKQLGEFLYDKLGFKEKTGRNGEPIRTESGKRATGAKVLATLAATTDAQRNFLAVHREWGKINAAITKALNYFSGVCRTAGGVFHADLQQTRTATHRLSSTGIPNEFGSVQFQNLARAFKRLFKAKIPGWLIAETDGAQLEFRVAAFLGQDKQAMADIANPEWDAHITSGSAMEDIPYDELYAAYKAGDKRAAKIRQDAKPETFKPLYGGSRGTPKQERWYEAFRKRYPDLARTQEGWVAQVVKTKRLITQWGLQFFFPNASMGKGGYVNVTASVYNYPVQSLATADIIPIAIVYLWHTVKERGLDHKIKMVNTVHDSVVCEIAPEVREQYVAIAEECFTRRVYTYLSRVYNLDFNVPLGVETKIATHWGDKD